MSTLMNLLANANAAPASTESANTGMQQGLNTQPSGNAGFAERGSQAGSLPPSFDRNHDEDDDHDSTPGLHQLSHSELSERAYTPRSAERLRVTARKVCEEKEIPADSLNDFVECGPELQRMHMQAQYIHASRAEFKYKNLLRIYSKDFQDLLQHRATASLLSPAVPAWLNDVSNQAVRYLGAKPKFFYTTREVLEDAELKKHLIAFVKDAYSKARGRMRPLLDSSIKPTHKQIEEGKATVEKLAEELARPTGMVLNDKHFSHVAYLRMTMSDFRGRPAQWRKPQRRSRAEDEGTPETDVDDATTPSNSAQNPKFSDADFWQYADYQLGELRKHLSQYPEGPARNEAMKKSFKLVLDEDRKKYGRSLARPENPSPMPWQEHVEKHFWW
ncbi:unnamed protein product [Peniophora sp. CBMAI 1063]|nr:unnamed protein product [Peniophora sp. CBMAI 1063]